MLYLMNAQLGVMSQGHKPKRFSAPWLNTSSERCGLPISVANSAQRSGLDYSAFSAQGVSQRIMR
jgi:hypothetical protein